MTRFSREYFERDPLTCAQALIGQELVAGPCAGIIVETEAYCAEGDEACHTFFRPSTREFMTVHEPGAAYVYLNYGMHWLLNVLVKGGGGGAKDGFVLIRAVEPLTGIDRMRERRGRHALRELCSGPGKLTQAFGITGEEHGANLCDGPVGLHARPGHSQVMAAPRVGITKAAHLPWRYLLEGSPFVSVPAGKEKPDAAAKRGRTPGRTKRL